MQTEINILHTGTSDFFITHIGLYKFNLIRDGSKIGFFACEEIINNPYETALRDELFADIRTNKTGSAGY
jgi:hypothetical protein